MSQSVTVIFGAGACGLLREPQSTLPPVRQRWPVPTDTECGDALCRPRLARQDAELRQARSTAGLVVSSRPGIWHVSTPLRHQNAVRPVDYAVYAAAAAALAVRVRPHVLYASDPLCRPAGALGIQAKRRSDCLYEHDSPDPGALRPWIARRRAEVIRAARLIIFPNEVRARIARNELGLPPRIACASLGMSLAEQNCPCWRQVARSHCCSTITATSHPSAYPKGSSRRSRRLDGQSPAEGRGL